ncbi:MAG TPA: hypothetical protein PL033_15930 [Candidatus Brocadiia bacterium]|nr:hypothetical protein [Candidatus Brocadiia bacterium]
MPEGNPDNTTFANRDNSRLRRIARIVTYAGHPSLVCTVGIGALAFHLCDDDALALRLTIVAAATIMIIPTLYTIALLKMGLISDPLFTVRAQRRLLFLPMGIVLVAGFFAMKALGAPPLMISIGICGAVGLAIAALITRFWKISLHTGGLSGIAAIGMLVWPQTLLFMIPFVACVAWSRVVLREHTRAQVIAGCIFGFTTTIIITSLVMNRI